MYLKVQGCILCLALVASAQSQQDVLQVNLNSPYLVFDKDFATKLHRVQEFLANVSQDNTFNNLFHALAVGERLPKNASDCFVTFKNLTEDFLSKKTYAIRGEYLSTATWCVQTHRICTHLVIDSWGRLGSGVLLGNVQWMGRYYECLNIRTPQFIGKYFYLELGIKSPVWRLLHFSQGFLLCR